MSKTYHSPFSKMSEGANWMVEECQVSIGDVLEIRGNIWRWKIVKEEGGTYSLGYIRHASRRRRKNNIYVIAPGKDPKNPYIAVYRIRNTSTVLEVLKIFKDEATRKAMGV
jgi:hypothetical protein